METGDLLLHPGREGHLVAGQPHCLAVLGDEALGGQAGERTEVYRLRQSQAAADFLGWRALPQRVLVVVGAQHGRQPALERAPAEGRIDHGVAIGCQVAEGYQVALFGQLRSSLQRFLPGQVGAAGEFSQAAGAPLLCHADNHVFAGAFVQQHQTLGNVRIEATVAAARVGVHHLPAAQGAVGGADDEVVALDHRQRLGQQQLHPTFRASRQLFGVEQPRPGRRLAGEQVKGHSLVVLQGMRGVVDHAEAGVHAAGRAQPAGGGEDFAALDVVTGNAGQVHCQSHARLGAGDAGLVALQSPYPGPLLGTGPRPASRQ